LRKYGDFEDFVVRGLRQNEAIRSNLHFLPQAVHLKNSDGAIEVDFTGRFENLQEDFDAVRRRLGFGDPLPWLNRSQPLAPGFRDHFSNRTAAIVSEFYEEDIETFGYDAL
jgi:chondroitin 4-sulfotransferase 11